jgi:hypothetical protein
MKVARLYKPFIHSHSTLRCPQNLTRMFLSQKLKLPGFRVLRFYPLATDSLEIGWEQNLHTTTQKVASGRVCDCDWECVCVCVCECECLIC